MGFTTFSEDHRRLAVIPEQSPPSSTERNCDRDSHVRTVCEYGSESLGSDNFEQDSPTCDPNDYEGIDSSESDEEDDLLSSRSRVHVDISHLVNDAEAAVGDDDEECYTRDASSDIPPAQGAFGPSPILLRRGRGPLALRTAVRGPESEELRRITDFSNDFEQCLKLQGGRLTNRQRRWLGLEEDADLQTLKRFSSPLRGSRNNKFLGSQLGKGFRRRPMWIPLSVMVAGDERIDLFG